jgi:hypothetical protein
LPKFIAAKSSWAALVATVVLAAALSSVQAQDGIQNPSGSCGVRTDGGRKGYLNVNAIWVPDCRNALHREYWRVFVRDGGQAHIIPRPDGALALHQVCADPRHELRSIVDRYRLCTAAASIEDVRIVNAMSASDALQMTHFLHGQLRFRVVVSGGMAHIHPFPMPSDIIDACESGRGPISPALDLRCQGARQPEGGFRMYEDGEAAEDLAARLNELYGIR